MIEPSEVRPSWLLARRSLDKVDQEAFREASLKLFMPIEGLLVPAGIAAAIWLATLGRPTAEDTEPGSGYQYPCTRPLELV